MKPHIINYVSNAANANSLRLSYIWSSNANNRIFFQNDTVKQLLSDYYREDKPEEIRKQIISALPDILPDISEGGDEGAIITNNYYILFTDKGDFFYNEYASRTARVLSESDWYQNYKETGIAATGYLPIITDQYDSYFRVACKAMRFYIEDMECFLLNTTDFVSIYNQFHVFEDFQIDDFLIYSNQNVIYQNLGTDSKIDLENYPSYMFDGVQYETKIWEDGNQIHFMTLCNYPQDEYRVAVTVSKDTLLSPFREVFLGIQVLLTGIIIVVLLLFLFMLRRILTRIVRMDKKMDSVRKGNYDVVITDTKHDEISNLANTFNMMLDKIKRDMANEEKMQYSLMVSAIDPHYIYNTLNIVTALAELGRNKDVVLVNNALIGTLKDRLKMKNYKTFDSVEIERKALEQYMTIQSYLYYQKIEMQFDVAECDLHLIIPKNIIQPLVENAIKHGILCKEDENGGPLPGTIKVAVYHQENNIFITIEDNGIGMPKKTIEHFFHLQNTKELQRTDNIEHIGIYNVMMRLNYLYQGNYQFSVESQIGSGTKIQIVIPYDETKI